MNLKDLKYLVAVADHLHFSKAADAVFISQPTLSGQIKKLEQRLQVTIFERTTRGVSITPIGEKIIAEARQTMAHAKNIENLAANQSGILCGELKLGIIPTIAPYLVPHFLSQALADYPELNLSLHEDKTETLYAMLDNFTIDAAITATEIPPANIEEIKLYRESFLLLCPTTHPLSNKSCIEAQDINPEDILLTTSNSNLDLLPSNIDLVGAEIEMIDLPNREKLMRRILGKVKDNYEFIIIDCSPSLGLITTNALAAADSIIIPVQCEYFALEGLGKLLNTIKIIQRGINVNLEIEGLLLTMYDSRLRLSNQVVDEVKLHFQELAFETIIQRNTKLSEAPSFGLPVLEHDAAARGSVNYLDLAREILQKNGLTKMASAEKILQ